MLLVSGVKRSTKDKLFNADTTNMKKEIDKILFVCLLSLLSAGYAHAQADTKSEGNKSLDKYCEEASKEELPGFIHFKEKSIRETWRNHCGDVAKNGAFQYKALETCSDIPQVDYRVSCLEEIKNAQYEPSALDYCSSSFKKNPSWTLACVKEIKGKNYESKLLQFCANIHNNAEPEKFQLFELKGTKPGWSMGCLKAVADKRAKDDIKVCHSLKRKSDRMECLKSKVANLAMQDGIRDFLLGLSPSDFISNRQSESLHINDSETVWDKGRKTGYSREPEKSLAAEQD